MAPLGIESLSGLGVHGGEPCRVDLVRREADGRGILFHFPGNAEPLALTTLGGLPRAARRSTVVGHGRVTLRTPEHLLASLLFFQEETIDVRLTAPEVPILDGSALPWREALGRLFPERAASPRWKEYDAPLVWEDLWEGGHLRVRPADRFRATYILERGPLRETAVLESPESAWAEVLPARTFIAYREWRRAMDSGEALLRGAEIDSGLLLAETPEQHAALLATYPTWGGGPFPLLNQSAWRMSSEPSRHKLVDLLGDLALLGAGLPALDIEIRNGGHSAHHRLLEKLAAFAESA